MNDAEFNKRLDLDTTWRADAKRQYGWGLRRTRFKRDYGDGFVWSVDMLSIWERMWKRLVKML